MRSRGKLLYWLGLSGFSLLVLGLAAGVLGPTRGAQAADGGEGWLGVRLQELTPRLRESMEVDEQIDGALVAGVVDGSPAAAAGIQDGDVIIEIDGDNIRSVDDAVDAVRNLDPGKKVLVVVERNGRQRGISVELGTRGEETNVWFAPESPVDDDVRDHYEGDRRRRPRASSPNDDRDSDSDDRRVYEWKSDDGDDVFVLRGKKGKKHKQYRVERAPRMEFERHADGGYLGVRTMKLGDQLAEYFGTSEEGGVLITEVLEDSPAAEAGLQAGDVILAVGDEDVESPRDLRRAVRDHEAEDEVTIHVLRDGSRRTINATLGDAKDFGGAFFIGPDDHMVALPDMPEILVPDIEDLHVVIPRALKEGLHGLEVLELDDLPELEELLELHDAPDIEIHGLHRKHMKKLHKQMKHLQHNLREIHHRMMENKHELHERMEGTREKREDIIRLRHELRERLRESRVGKTV